ncbi:hypothetical protein AMATHDRAFT_152661 [Amanita thiersii Skay4041]|uniref:Formamidase n=1 Tax=Amanita thiersii Skay4041 TaxID=703135 RepID=A0A2A9NG43_9AGAR|nr:hypothetical protein AMATHDRAFT_152661 [Amanita thiersii Skay4041]
MSTLHSIKRSQNHLAWDNSIPPVLRIASGDVVTFDCLDASNGQITPKSTNATISSLVFSQLDQVNGPVFVEGAQPGDTLQVDVISVEVADWGWTGLIPGFGLLSDEFSDPALKIWALDRTDMVAYFDEKRKIRIPLKPFAGEMGVASGKNGAFSTIPPYNTGGNIDTKHLTAGSTLYLPVEVEGGLFSIGDGHAAQGDGGTAIETPMTVSVRLSVVKDRGYIKTPHFRTLVKESTNQRSSSSTTGGKGLRNDEYYCTTGVDPDLRTATKAAVRHMIEFLGSEHKLDRVSAYMLCSVAGDLRLHEVVDMPNYVVGMMMPQWIFVED